MPITSQIKIPGATTHYPLSASSLSDEYYLAWTNPDTTISWTTIDVNSVGDSYGVGPINASGFLTQLGYGPALANLNEQVWMAFLENPTQAPWIASNPPDQKRQPPVIMVSSLNEITWSTPQPLWDPGLTASDVYVPGISQAAPVAISAPAMAVSQGEILVVWVEYAVNGVDTLGAVSDGKAVSPGQPQIFFSIYNDGSWSLRQAVTGALTRATPTVTAAPGGGFYMAWKGESDDHIWFAKFIAGVGWTETARLPGFETSAGPALAMDSSGSVQLVWKGKADDSLYMSQLGPSGWSPAFPGNNWSTQFQMAAMATPLQPALASQLATPAVLLAFSGVTSHAVYVAPLTSVGAVFPGPAAGNVNYMITNYDIDDPLRNITVTVVANQDLVNFASYTGKGYKPVGDPLSPGGFGFQLNCQPPGTITGTGPYPPAGQDVWEQYGIAVQGTQFSMWYDNSWISGVPPLQRMDLFSLPDANTIPKGYRIEMKLVTDPKTNNVTTLSVNAWDNHGHPIKGGGGSTPVDGPWTMTVPSNYQAPILNLQFNVGGPDNGQYANFQSGPQSGPLATVSYKADSPLMVTPATNLETAESANISFDLLAGYPANPIVQTFKTS